MKTFTFSSSFIHLLLLLILASSVHGELVIVTNTDDSGAGSLRQAIIDTSAAGDYTQINFDPTLAGETIKLSSDITITHQNGLTINGDFVDKTKGITLDGQTSTRIFKLDGAGSVTMNDILFTRGNSIGSSFSGAGGAIQSHASDLNLYKCCFIDNTQGGIGGAAIHASGTGSLFMRNCTFSFDPNAGSSELSASILIAGSSARLVHCTLAGKPGNPALTGLNSSTVITLQNSIIEGDLKLNDGKLIQIDRNIIGGTLDAMSGVILEGTTAINADPLLEPLDDNGGRFPTMNLLPGSPAVDPSPASETQGATTDQRGSPRQLDGDSDGSAEVDIGALEAVRYVVKNTNDSGAGSLRQALADANADNTSPYASQIVFDPELAGETISPLTFIRLTTRDAFVSLDGRNLIPGITLSGSPALSSYVFLNVGSKLKVSGLTFANGTDGGFYNGGQLIATNCLFYNNMSDNGGGLLNFSGDATLINCTFFKNQSLRDGGAIHNEGSLSLIHCTLTGNAAKVGGGGLSLSNASQTIIYNTLITDNTQGVARKQRHNVFIYSGGSLTGGGTNIINSLISANNTISPAPLDLNPQLLPLAEYGGSTKTMPPSLGSPAIDAATVLDPIVTVDQRGVPRAIDGDLNGSSLPDVGAVEVLRLDEGLMAYYDFEELGDAGLTNKAPDTTGFDATRGQAAAWTASPSFITGPGFGGHPIFSTVNGSSDRSDLVAGNALNLDSIQNQFIRVPLGSSQLGNSFTISAWHALTPGSDNNNARFFVFEANANFDVSWGTPNQPTTSGPLSELNYAGYVGGVTGAATSRVLPTGSWQHVTQVFSSDFFDTTLSLYINGVYAGSHTAPTANVNFSSLKFGNARDGQSRYWDGMIDEVGLWNRALTADEVYALYLTKSMTKTLDTPPASWSYSSWIASNYPGVTDIALIDPTADPDMDNLDNAIEYLLGGNPADPTDAGLAPTLEPEGNFYYFKYNLNRTAAATTILETSPDLVEPWSEVGAATQLKRIYVDDSSDVDQVEIRLNGHHLGDKAFFRLRSTIPSP